MSTNPQPAALYRVQGRSNRLDIARHPQCFRWPFIMTLHL